MVKDIEFCMMTTVDENGDLHSRPMSINGDIDRDGDLWFFTSASSHKVAEITKLPKVNVSFADPDNQHYVSISGKAQLVRDRNKIDELWRPELPEKRRTWARTERSNCKPQKGT
jgi:general stress protein 26